MSRLWRRLRRLLGQNRIRLSAADLRPHRPRAGDRLLIAGKELVVGAQGDPDPACFRLHDPRLGGRWLLTVDGQHFELQPEDGGPALRLHRRDVLLLAAADAADAPAGRM